MVRGNIVVDIKSQNPLYASQRNTVVLKYDSTNVVYIINIRGVEQTLQLLHELIDAFIYHHGDLQLMIGETVYTFDEQEWIAIFKALDCWFTEYLYDKIDYYYQTEDDLWDK